MQKVANLSQEELDIHGDLAWTTQNKASLNSTSKMQSSYYTKQKWQQELTNISISRRYFHFAS